MADWAGFLPDLLFLIASCITEPEDFVSFRSVCSTWRHATLRAGSTLSLNPFRWHFFKLRHKVSTFCGIYSFKKHKFYQISLSELATEKMRLTNEWFFTIFPDHETRLVYPFSRQVIPLPPLPCYAKKVVLSTSPSFSTDHFVVMVLDVTSRSYFYKSKDREWSAVEYSDASFEDIMYWKGQTYALDNQGVVYACNVRGCNPITKVPIERKLSNGLVKFFYLVGNIDNHDSVLMVVKDCKLQGNVDDVDNGRYYRKYYDYTVYEVDLSGKRGWRKIKDLGSRTIFLSCLHGSFCIQNSKLSPGIFEKDEDIYFRNCQDGNSITKSAQKIEISTRICNLNDGIKRQFFHPITSLTFSYLHSGGTRKVKPKYQNIFSHVCLI